MSNPDSFLDEVAEEVRRDRLYFYIRRYGWIAVVAVVAIVGGAAANEWRKAQQASVAQAFGDALIASSQSADAQTRLVTAREIKTEGTQTVVRDLLIAGELSQSDPLAAGDTLRAIIDNAEVEEVYRDLARLKLVQMADNRLTTDQRLAVLDPMVMGSGPFRLSALELRALVYVEQHETEAALADLKALAQDAEAAAGQSQRARQLMIALGGDPEAL